MNPLYPELSFPPKLKSDTIRVVPLGGLGEVGRNMTVIELNGKILIVDCGVLFPEEIQPGVDLILPDFSYLHGRMDQVVGLVLTHGHEDHIGAVPYLLRLREDIPIYGSQLTLDFLRPKLEEHRLPATRGGTHRARHFFLRIFGGHPLDTRCPSGNDTNQSRKPAGYRRLQNGSVAAR